LFHQLDDWLQGQIGILVSENCCEVSQMRWLWGLLCHTVDDHRICPDIGSSHVLKFDVFSQEMPSHIDVTRGRFVSRMWSDSNCSLVVAVDDCRRSSAEVELPQEHP
jgi:hypothetical protein